MDMAFFSLCFYVGLAGYTASLVFFSYKKEKGREVIFLVWFYLSYPEFNRTRLAYWYFYP